MIMEETIFAYIDGELEDEDRVRIEQAIAADPKLQAIVSEHRALAAQLTDSFATILEAPVPHAIARAAKPDDSILYLADARSRQERRNAPRHMTHWAALAATLVAGIVGGTIFSGRQQGPVTERAGQLVASGQLALALDTQLASTQVARAPVRIGLTFRNHAGAICRSFAAETTAGVACRDGKAWQLKALLAREKADTGDYRMAAASSATAELVDNLIVGEALNQAQERAALATDWAVRKQP